MTVRDVVFSLMTEGTQLVNDMIGKNGFILEMNFISGQPLKVRRSLVVKALKKRMDSFPTNKLVSEQGNERANGARDY